MDNDIDIAVILVTVKKAFSFTELSLRMTWSKTFFSSNFTSD